MSLRLFWRMLWRESRGARGRLLWLGASVAVAVAAVVGLGSLVDAIERGIRLRSRELLGGDLAIESRRPLPDITPLLPEAYRALPQVRTSILSTMVSTAPRAGDARSQLVELKAVDRSRGPYPLAGALTLTPTRPLDTLLDDHSVLVAPILRTQLGLALGDTLYVGGEPLRVTGYIEAEPDPLAFSLSLGPRVLVSTNMLARTQLLAFGNRTRHRTLLALASGASGRQLEQLKQTLAKRIPGAGSYVSIETHAEAQPALRGVLERVQRYLALVALLSLLLASVGVAQSVSAWLSQLSAQTAVLRCLGFLPREVLLLYLGQVLLFALLGSLVGGALGLALPWAVARSHVELLPQAALTVSFRALAHGMALGVFVPAVCSLGPLTSVYGASPARVLRSEAAPLPVPRVVKSGALALMVLGVFGASWLESGELLSALGFAVGSASVTGLLWLAARALSRGVGRLPKKRLPVLVWHGVAAIARPAAGTTGSIVALGLGAMIVLTIVLLEGMLDRSLDSALPARAPSMFLLDIQPDQWPDVERRARALGASKVDSVPVVMARLAAIDGRGVRQLLQARPGKQNERNRGQWVLTREQRISWMRELPSDNRVVAGALWSDPGVAELSVEVGFARDLAIGLGSMLRFDVQGVELDFKVTSLRTVKWRSFSSNFFLVAEPGTLDDAPHFRFGAVRMPPAAEQQLQNELARSAPNVTMLRTQGLLERAQGVLRQAALAVRLLGSFAVLTGLIILMGAVLASQLRRTREAALWKVLGLTRLQVVTLFAVEYALLGAVAATLGAAAAYGLTLAIARQLLELPTWPSWQSCAIAVLATTLLSVVCGLLASVRALLAKPLDVLHGRR